MNRAGYRIKRVVDFVAAAGGLVVLSPAIAVIALAIRLDSPGSPFFLQQRLGRHGKPFRLIKFRTMRAAPIRFHDDGTTRVDPDDDRVTRIGRFLRGGLDELPQLINVLRGEMSLIGPRPDLVVQRASYAGDEVRKLDVLPGITSAVAVSGRDALPWKRRIAMDLRYIHEWSLRLDLEIAIATVRLALPRLARLHDLRDHGKVPMRDGTAACTTTRHDPVANGER